MSFIVLSRSIPSMFYTALHDWLFNFRLGDYPPVQEKWQSLFLYLQRDLFFVFFRRLCFNCHFMASLVAIGETCFCFIIYSRTVIGGWFRSKKKWNQPNFRETWKYWKRPKKLKPLGIELETFFITNQVQSRTVNLMNLLSNWKREELCLISNFKMSCLI